MNQLMRGYATRNADDGQTELLIDPGHNRTRLGGPDARCAPRRASRPWSTCSKPRPAPLARSSWTGTACRSRGSAATRRATG